ncbi:LysR substrate-binding domain-containing protein [uncultured Thiothrix sp.]|uniref:LysR substrate-binding domain-containing protein n=1 Tax=uncultured Thiothrix sp. TaxID=223185 RepID=UPI0026029797|nr:LysR substrate-binding domain-containing protein [uncultured Thiothrix sp.]HMT91519.1 LysR substrate-binding domain-containing protein [Thiolinea sp.]
MRKIPPLKALQAFEAASRLGSFAAASDELHLTPSAISHQIRLLEQQLGVTLFHRVHRAVELTDIGRRYAEVIAEAFGLIEANTRSIERTGKSDILTIHSVPSFATQWLMPRLSRFSALNPDIDVRLNASVATIDLAAGEADFDIRYGSVFPSSGMEVQPFPEETIVITCSPKVLVGQTLNLAETALIHSEINLYTWREWQRDHPETKLPLDRGLRFDRSFMAINAAVDGLGVAIESRLMIERELEAGKLILPFGMIGPKLVCHRLTYLKTKAHFQKMKAFRQWLFEELNKTMANLT